MEICWQWEDTQVPSDSIAGFTLPASFPHSVVRVGNWEKETEVT
jgi:Cys-tRNA synthase (O-phospho-L-seryl-tRNA:Cys-tRNA synthase)